MSYYDLDVAAHYNQEAMCHIWTLTVIAQKSAPITVRVNNEVLADQRGGEYQYFQADLPSTPAHILIECDDQRFEVFFEDQHPHFNVLAKSLPVVLRLNGFTYSLLMAENHF